MRPTTVISVRAVVGVVLTAFLFLAYRGALVSVFGPEDPLHFTWNADLSWTSVIAKYFDFTSDDGWYRPTTFHLHFKFFDYLLSWHDFVAIRILNLLVLAGAAFCVFLLGDFLFRDRWIALMGAIYFASLPALYAPIYSVNSCDFFYLIYCAATALLLWRSAQAASGRTYSAALIVSLFAVTSKEAALALPFFLFVADFFFFPALSAHRVSNGTVPWHLQRMIRTLPFFVAPLLILAFKCGGHTPIDLDAARNHLSLFFQWLCRLYYLGYMTRQFADGPSQLVGKVNILVLLLALVTAMIRSVRQPGYFRTWWAAQLCVVWTVSFLLMPALVGGQTWHVTLSAMGFSLLWAWAVHSLLPKGSRSQVFAAAALIGLFFILSQRNFSAWVELHPFKDLFEMNSVTLANPPVAKAALKPGTSFLVLDSAKLHRWSYGVGSLFPFVYLRQDIGQVQFPEADAGALVKWAGNPERVCVDWDPKAKAWNVLTAECDRLVQARLQK